MAFMPGMENIGMALMDVLSGQIGPANNVIPQISQSNNPLVNNALAQGMQAQPQVAPQGGGFDFSGFLANMFSRPEGQQNDPGAANLRDFMQTQTQQQQMPQQTMMPIKMGQMPQFNPFVAMQPMQMNVQPVDRGGFGMTRARF